MAFLVSIDGMRAPEHEHDSFEKALKEAARLSRNPGTFKRKIRVLKEVAAINNINNRLLSNLQILDRNQLITVGEMLDIINSL